MRHKPQYRIVVLYLITASLWILLSDSALYMLDVDLTLFPGLSILKGIGFVLVTSAILFSMLDRELQGRYQLETQLREQVQQSRQSQTGLEQSENRFRKAIEEAPLPTMIFSEDGEVLTISRSWLEITGYDAAQLKTVDAWTELAYGERKQPVKEAIDRLFDLTHRVDEGDFVINCRDGSQRVWEFSSTSLGRLPDSRRIAMSIANDVTERRRAEESARRNYTVLQRFFDNSHFLLAYLDRNFNFIQVNERYAQADGKTPEFFAGKNHFALYPHAENEAIFQRVVDTQEPVIFYSKPFAYPLNPERGASYWDWSLKPVLDTNGMVESLVFTLVDVTERVRAEQQLHVMASAIESSIMPIALSNMEGQITYVNAAYVQLWKLKDAAQAIGRSVLEFWASADEAQAVIDTLYREDTFVGELTARLFDGTQADIELRLTLVRDANGQAICSMGSFRDLTAQQQAEVVAVENERLKALFQKEQERNALVQRIISMLSHDLRGSLTVISTARFALQQYIDRLTPDQRREQFETIERHVQFALELLADTVNIARGNLSETSFRPAPVNIAALCQVSVDEVEADKHVSHQLHFRNLSGTEMVAVDEVLVSRILVNLLSNAIKYSPPGSDVRLELDQHDQWIVLRVIDQGMGINEADLPRIFDPFFRGQAVRPIRGTGLGLSIVKDCVTRHQGRIRVDSTIGQGSTFTVELPLQPMEQLVPVDE